MLITQILLTAMLAFTNPRFSSLVSSFTATSWRRSTAAAAARGAHHRQISSTTPPCSLLFQRTKSLHMIYSSQRILPLQRPPDPSSFTKNTATNSDNAAATDDCNGKEEELDYIQTQTNRLQNWLQNKSSILVITGAGISTDSGIPDYRGNKGSYFNGHKPIIHHEYMSFESIRKRYWARSLIGYSPFRNAKPNLGHVALARLEELNLIGVDLTSAAAAGGGGSSSGNSNIDELLQDSCYGPSIDNNNNNNRNQRLSIITQNVDILHSKAGSKHVLHLHGRGDIVKCMNCGVSRDRQDYHDMLLDVNRDWMEGAMKKEITTVVPSSRGERRVSEGEGGALSKEEKEEEVVVVPLRPDGDADWYQESYDGMKLPPCPECGTTTQHHGSHKHHDGKKDGQGQQHTTANNNSNNSFYKTDVVFFGDSVPKHRFDIAYTAIDAADGVLCIGTSLAVHSAYRLVKRAIDNGTDVAILNVGETRIESEGLDKQEPGLVTKIESPIGETLAELVRRYSSS